MKDVDKTVRKNILKSKWKPDTPVDRPSKVCKVLDHCCPSKITCLSCVWLVSEAHHGSTTERDFLQQSRWALSWEKKSISIHRCTLSQQDPVLSSTSTARLGKQQKRHSNSCLWQPETVCLRSNECACMSSNSIKREWCGRSGKCATTWDSISKKNQLRTSWTTENA